jgi:hypothetical protein
MANRMLTIKGDIGGMSMNTLSKTLLFGCVGLLGLSHAQSADSVATANAIAGLTEKVTEIKGKVGGIEEDYLATKATVDKLAKIKMSGYIQAQFRYAPDTTGQFSIAAKDSALSNNYKIGEFQGGNFPDVTQSVFQVRRARIKVAYETPLTQSVIQLDCLPFTTATAINSTTQDTSGKYKVSTKTGTYLLSGGVTIKDAYFRLTEPWLKSIALKVGVFDRPFGYEISYSSSSRESPERSRIFQILFPGERDLGFSVEYFGSENLPLIAQYINFKGGLFAGNGINIETDDIRDFIGRLGASVPLTDFNVSIDGGISAYVGKIRDRSDLLYKISGTDMTSSTGNKGKDIERQYFGGDLQLYYGDVPFLGGISLKGEYIQGKQPGTSATSQSCKSDLLYSNATTPVYLRKFSGFYGIIALNIDPIKSQLVGKYDVYDPNTDLALGDIKNATDLKYTTIGGGLIYHWDENIKFIAYYDKVENEISANVTSTPAGIYSKDINDDVFTFRIQYKY